MSDFDATSLDLNLLLALDALLEARSVTKAARKLRISQSAMSHRLRRLREELDDPVVIVHRRGLVPSQRAEQMAEPLRESLRTLQALISRGGTFEPRTSRRRFRLASSDLMELVALPRLLELLAERAPNVRLSVEARLADPVARLRAGNLDLVFAPRVGSVPGVGIGDRGGIRQRIVSKDGFRVLFRADHPRIGSRISLKRYLELDHLLVSPGGQPGGLVDLALARRGLRRNVAAQVSHFVSAPFITARTDLVLTCPTALAREAVRYASLRHVAPPLKLEPIETYMFWHERSHADLGHRWLRDLAAEMTSKR